MIKRRTLALAAAVVSSALAVSTAAYAAAAAPWPQSDFNAAHSRANLAETALSSASVAAVDYLRGLAVPPPDPTFDDVNCSTGVRTDPIIAGGVLYAVGEHRLAAYTLATGALKWSVTIDPQSISTYGGLALSGGHLVLAHEGACVTNDPSGVVTSFDPATGAVQWNANLSTPVEEIVVSGNTVVVGGASLGSGSAVKALNLATGAPVWTKESCLSFTKVPMLVVKGNVVFNTCAEDGSGAAIEAVTLTTGAHAWTKSGAWQLQRGDSDASTAAHLYLSGSNGVTDVNPATGATRYTLPGAGATVLAVGASRVFTNCSSHTDVCAYNRANGAALWTATGPAAPLAVANDVVYLADGRALKVVNGSVITDLWTGEATRLSVGAGYIAVVVNPRVIDLYGATGR